jgi:hypothetical protein
MKNQEVKEVEVINLGNAEEVKAEMAKIVKVDRRKNNPGRPKSEKALVEDEFKTDLYKKETKFNYASSNYKIVGDQLMKESYDEALQEQYEMVGVIDKVMPTKFRVQTQTLVGTNAEVVIKHVDIKLIK